MQSTIQIGGTARSPADVRELLHMGLRFAEIPITDPEDFPRVINEYRAILKNEAIFYLCHGPREGDPNDVRTLETVYLPKLLKILTIMPELGMRILTVHFWMDPRFVAPDVIAYKTGFLQRFLRTAQDADITVCLENLSEDANHLAPVFEALPALNLTLDLGHAQLLGRQNTSVGFMRRFPERIRHIHLHDNRGGNTPAEDIHLPVGEGIIDFETIFRSLNVIKYRQTITLELTPDEIQKNLETVRQRLAAAGFRV